MPDTNHLMIDVQRALYDRENARIPNYRDYALGIQKCTLTEKQKNALKGVLNFDLADNICHSIIAEAADRISLQSPKERTEDWVKNAAVQAFIDELFVKNALDDLQGETYYDCLQDGNIGLRVDWKSNGLNKPPYGRVVLIPEPWWDGVQGVFIHNGDDGSKPYAVKEWWEGRDPQNSPPVTATQPVSGVDSISSRRKRRTIWYEDRIEQWFSPNGSMGLTGNGGWEPLEIVDETGKKVGPVIPWIKKDGSPLHIPIIHFPNAGRMTGAYGVSELSGGIMHFQDEINDAQASLTVTLRNAGFPVMKMSGYTAPKDENGNPIALEPEIGPGDIFADTNPEFDLDRIPPSDVQPILDGILFKIQSACRVSRTPMHRITGGDWPSGAALEKAETPAINKAKRQAAKFAPAWATVFHRAVEIANVYGKAGLDEDALIEVTFAPFEVRDPMYALQLERQQLDLENAKQGIVPEPEKQPA